MYKYFKDNGNPRGIQTDTIIDFTKLTAQAVLGFKDKPNHDVRFSDKPLGRLKTSHTSGKDYAK